MLLARVRRVSFVLSLRIRGIFRGIARAISRNAAQYRFAVFCEYFVFEKIIIIIIQHDYYPAEPNKTLLTYIIIII